MKKRNNIVFWIATLWLCLGMVSTGSAQLRTMEKGPGASEMLEHLGYPEYLMILLGILKLAAALVLLIPRFPILKEWAYAGCFFLMFGAVWSHAAMSDPLVEWLPALFLLFLTVVSWYFRPAGRKMVQQA